MHRHRAGDVQVIHPQQFVAEARGLGREDVGELAPHHRRGHPVLGHVAPDGAGHDLARLVATLGLTVDTVVNAAGAGRTEQFADSDAAVLHQQLALNVHAVVDVSHAFLPQLVRSGRGALVNVASLTGYMPVPGMAVYAASKAFVIRFTEALAH